MPRIKVSQIISEVYQKCGNVTRNQLPLELVLTYLYNQLDKRRVQMRLTEQNELLKKQDRLIIDAREFPVAIDDFGDPVAIHLISPDVNQKYSQPLEIVNFNTLPAYEADGQMRVALYGGSADTGLMVRFSTAVDTFLNWTLRFWYEPDDRTRGVNAEVPINPLFLNLISSVVSLDCLPYVEIDPTLKADITRRLMENVGNVEIEGSLENEFYKEISSSKQYGNNVRRPFRAGAPTNARYRR